MVFKINKLLFLAPLIIILDIFLIQDIITSKKLSVLGANNLPTAKIRTKKFVPPKIDANYINQTYPSLTLTVTPTSAPLSIKASPTPTISGTDTPNQPTVPNGETSILDQINRFRSSNGKHPLSANNETCSFAGIRAGEISSNFNHDGFSNRVRSKTLPYPSFSEIAENIAMNTDANKVVPGWIDSPGHKENMLKDVPHGCVASNGNYYVFEAWKP